MKFSVLTALCVAGIVIMVVLSNMIPVSIRMTDALVEARTNEMTSLTHAVGKQFAGYFTDATVGADMMERFWNQSVAAAPEAPVRYLIEKYEMALYQFLASRETLTACYIAVERRQEEMHAGQPCDVDGLLLSTTYRAVFLNDTTGNYSSCPKQGQPGWPGAHPHRACSGFGRLVRTRGSSDVADPLAPVAVMLDLPCQRWLLASTHSLNANNITRNRGDDPANPVHGLTQPSWGWSWPYVAGKGPGGNAARQSVVHGSFRPLARVGYESKLTPVAFCSLTMSEKRMGGAFQSLGGILADTVVAMKEAAADSNPVLFVLSYKKEFVASSLPDVVPERIEGSPTDLTQAQISGLKQYDNETLPEDVRAVGAWVVERSCPEGAPACDFTTLPEQTVIAGHVVVMNALQDPAAKNLGLVLVMMVPESEIKQPAKDAQKELIIISVIVFVVAVAASTVFGVAVSMPIQSVCGLMLKAATLDDLDGIVTVTEERSLVSEIASMQSSLQELVKALIMYKGFLPQNIVDHDEEDEEEVDEITAGNASGKVKGNASGQVSMRSSKTSGSKRSGASSMAAPHAAAALKLASDRTSISSLSRKRVSFVAVNIKGWHRQASELSDAKLLSAHGAYIAQCLKVFQGQRGITDAFSGDKLVCSFNAAKTVSGHRVSACEALVQIRDAVSPGLGLEMSSAAACGEARVGNMGCGTMRKFSFVSPVLAWVRVLERYSSAMGVSCLVDDLVGEETRGQYTQMLVDEVLFTKRSGRPLRVNALGGKIEVGEGEWMYQLEEAGNRTDPHKLWNDYAVAVLEENFHRAQTIGGTILEDAPSAAVRARMEAAVEARAFAPTEIAWH